MKALVIYDSIYGNTKLIADVIAEEISDGTLSRSVNDVKTAELDEIDLLIMGSPINGWRPTKKITDFLKNLPPDKLTRVQATAFDTRLDSFISGNAAKKIAQAMQSLGADLIVPEMGFYVKSNEGPLEDGEMKKVEDWIKLIRSKMKDTAKRRTRMEYSH